MMMMMMMSIEPTITRATSRLSGHKWFETKIVFKNNYNMLLHLLPKKL